MNKKGFFIVLLSVLLSALTAYAVADFKDDSRASNSETAYDSEGQVVKTVNLSLTDYPDFTYAAENCVEAVVFIKVAGKQEVQYYNPFDDFFSPFFGGGGNGQPQTREKEFQGSGSGVIIRQDGYIVTNNHVVANASSVEVTMNNNKTYEAKVIGADPATDVALIKVDAEGLPFINFADSDKLRLGEWVLAIGSPLGAELRSTITAGIVSAKGRSMPSNGEFKIESFIQTDAAVNPGNSGGALVNKEGMLVGINTAIVSTTGAYSGYSFAVPSNIVRKIVADLIDFGSVKRVMLGIRGGNVDALRTDEKMKKIIDELDLPAPVGVYVSEVENGGSAYKAGIKEKDVIVGIDSTRINSMSELQAAVNNFHPGDKAQIKLIRGGKELSLNVEFIGVSGSTGTVGDDGTISFYGAKLKEADNGVLIVEAGRGKVAQAGGEDGFLIQFVNDQKVSKPQEVIDIVKKAKRSIFVEGLTASGRKGYFGFGKDE